MSKIGKVTLWVLATLCVIIITTLPISLQTQLIASITAVTMFAVIKILKAQGTGG